jgi:RNA polymerase sigma factor CnrH
VTWATAAVKALGVRWKRNQSVPLGLDCAFDSAHERTAAAEAELACASASVTDSELVGRALNGAEEAFERLLERHLQHVQRLIAKRLRDPDDVLDVLQDTRLAVWKALSTYDTDRPFEAWVTSIALNKCRDWGRRRIVRTRLLLQMQEHLVLQEGRLHSHSPERLMIEREKVHALRRALDKLPQQFRQPLVLTTFRELSQADAGRALKLTPKAVENRVRRARGRLAQALLAEGAR